MSFWPQTFYQVEDGSWRPVPKPIPLKQVIRAALLNAMAYTDGDQKRASHLLELSPRVFDYQLGVHGIPARSGRVSHRHLRPLKQH